MKRPRAPRRLQRGDFKAAITPDEYRDLRRWYWFCGVCSGAGGLLVTEILLGLARH
jgi:hypothetical protein